MKAKPFPMYCQLCAISGFEAEKAMAEQVLSQHDTNIPTIYVKKINETDYLYSQCNFKREKNDKYEFKFLDEFNSLIKQNAFPILIGEHSVKRVLFAEMDVFDRFCQHPQLRLYKRLYKLITT